MLEMFILFEDKKIMEGTSYLYINSALMTFHCLFKLEHWHSLDPNSIHVFFKKQKKQIELLRFRGMLEN